jgi:thiol:disulfide interchange protein DsbA
MKRRDFFTGATSLVAGAVVLSPGIVLAQAKALQAGVDYVKLAKPAVVVAPAGKVEVVEFFWYSCPHCNAFEPVLAEWVKRLPKHVAFRRVPIAFRADYIPQQQLFYALDAMGLLDKLHARVFAAIHGEKQNLAKADAITDWVVKQGVDKAKFLAQFNSFDVARKSTGARDLMTAYQVEGVPAMGVAGRFYTDGSMAKSMDRALLVADFLVAEVKAGR